MNDIDLEVIDMIQFTKGGPLGVRDWLGTARANGEPSTTFDQRIKRCFELCTWAMLDGPPTMAQARLVHGSWMGPEAEHRIRHAWIELPGGLIWEPIFAAVFLESKIVPFARMWAERTYDQRTTIIHAKSSDHYGPWHESRYP